MNLRSNTHVLKPGPRARLTRMGVSESPSRSSRPCVKAAALVCTRPSSEE